MFRMELSRGAAMDILAERMKLLRKEADIKQESMAEQLGLSMSAYRRYENGTREPMAPTIVALARYFGVSADYLLGLTETRALSDPL